MTDNTYDVVVIGAGPGGYVTAIRAAQLGLKCAVVEREHLGGICLNWGCIPTKALLRTSEVYHNLTHAEDFGLKADKVGYDAGAIVKRSRAVSERLTMGVTGLLKKNKVDVIWGEAKITRPGELQVSKPTKKPMEPQPPTPRGAKGEGTYKARHIIIATGARPRVLKGLEPDGKQVWTYFEAMVPESIPKSLLVIGSGAIGIEFASFYRTLGSEVTVVEVLPEILPAEDEEIAKFARKRLEKQGMKIVTGAKVTKLDKKKDSVTASIEDEKGTSELKVEKVISAVGVVGNIEGLGLEDLGVKIEKGLMAVDGYGRSNVEGIYAIGDVAGPPMLAHKASHE
ncbi:MAG: dihydrolipoyl dehydrogenase, partial [Hyphomicrobiales bacterium]